MTPVERRYPSFAWAEPVRGNDLSVVVVGDKLQISGFFPTYRHRDPPTDLLSGYGAARKSRSGGKQKSGQASPHVVFANADSDEKLTAFVRAFGPVVAESVHQDRECHFGLRSGRLRLS